MIIEIAKQDLETALQQVKPSMSTKDEGDDITGNYLFRAVPAKDENDQNKAEVLAGHSLLFSTVPLQGAVVSIEENEPTMFAIEGQRLKLWLQTTKDEALTLKYNSDEAEVQVERPFQSFEARDPSKYRLWDRTVKEAELTGKAKGSQLREAFLYAARFVSENRHRPSYLVFEARGGKLLSAEDAAASLVAVPGLDKKATFRIEGKDAPKLASFLQLAGDDDVEVLEHKRAVILKRDTGALIGYLRPREGFPADAQAGKNADDDQVWWDVPVADLKRGIQVLTCGADSTDNRLRLQQKGDDTAVLSMETKTGKTVAFEIEGITTGALDDAKPLPDKGVLVSHFILSKLLDLHPEDTIRLGFNHRKVSGFLRYTHKANEVEYLTVVAWLRDHV